MYWTTFKLKWVAMQVARRLGRCNRWLLFSRTIWNVFKKVHRFTSVRDSLFRRIQCEDTILSITTRLGNTTYTIAMVEWENMLVFLYSVCMTNSTPPRMKCGKNGCLSISHKIDMFMYFNLFWSLLLPPPFHIAVATNHCRGWHIQGVISTLHTLHNLNFSANATKWIIHYRILYMENVYAYGSVIAEKLLIFQQKSNCISSISFVWRYPRFLLFNPFNGWRKCAERTSPFMFNIIKQSTFIGR